MSTTATNILNGDALLFVGAGFSLGATNIRKDGRNSVPLAGDLAAELCAQMSIPKIGNLALAAQKALDNKRFGREYLRSALRSNFVISDVRDYHENLVMLPWRRIYSTNYDNVVEHVSNRLGKPIFPVTCSTPPRNVDFTLKWCVHIHGFVGFIDRDTEMDEFALTDSDFLADRLQSTRWLKSLHSDIEVAKSVLFLGYSLKDINIRRALFQRGDWREKTTFIVSPHLGYEDEVLLEKYGQVRKVGVADFSVELKAASAGFVPKAHAGTSLSALERVELPIDVPAKVSDDARWNLLVAGLLDPRFFAAQRAGLSKERYLVDRHQAAVIERSLFSSTKNVVIHSNLGNGKTTLCAQLAYNFEQAGVRYYRLIGGGASLSADLEKVCEEPGQLVIEVENYTRHMREIEEIQHHRNPRTACILTSRSALHDAYAGRLSALFDGERFYEFDVNRLGVKELNDFKALIQDTGAVGDAEATGRWTEKYLSTTLNAEVSSILLDVMNSPNIRERLRAAWVDVLGNDTVWRACVGACILDALGYEDNLDILFQMNFLKPENWGVVQSDVFLQEFFRFHRASLTLRSPVLATYLISSIDDRKRFIDLLVEVATVAAECAADDHDDREAVALFRDLMLFANIVRFFSGAAHDGEQLIVAYYEGIKNCPMSKWQTVFFWLQYSIARTVAKKFEQAWAYLRTAKGLAEKIKGFRDFHIANHEARLWLEEQLEYKGAESSFAAFSKAHAILRGQIRDPETRFHPYTVARKYREFATRYVKDWSNSEREAFANACSDVLRGVEALSYDLRSDHRVIACERDISQCLAR